MCHAEIFRYHYLRKNSIKLINGQPEQLTEQLAQGNHSSPKSCYPTEIPLMSCKCRKKPFILRYHPPNY